MNDVRDIFERVLETPLPPRRPGTEAADVVAAAHRAVRRRSRRRLLGTGLALAAVGTAVAISSSPITGARPHGLTAPAASSSPTVSIDATMPGTTAVIDSRPRIAEAMRRAVPAGYSLGPVETLSPWLADVPGIGVVATYFAAVGADGRTGSLDLYYAFEGHAADRTDPCGTSAVARLAQMGVTSTQSCGVLAAGGIDVRAVFGVGPSGSVIAVTRFLDGGYVTAVAQQGTLVTPPLTTTALGFLLTSPEVIPGG